MLLSAWVMKEKRGVLMPPDDPLAEKEFITESVSELGFNEYLITKRGQGYTIRDSPDI